jgi:UDP-N-acetylmuramate: L-alanyl-gamma-D-glutamyl-meso-diaminopimelate ligase
MKIHILGICGTFMGGIAVLAKQMGHHVAGSDHNVYPPMSTQLAEQGITLFEGFDPQQIFQDKPDLVIIGNAMSRGNPAVEYALNNGMHYISGPQWLADHCLQDRHVLAVAGTHGKTTTSSILAWILEYAGLEPGFLIGGVPENFGVSSRIGKAPYFVMEADEYDTSFFDKRSKFIHYHPRTLLMNNLEFDHADIFENLNAIEKEFHHLVRTVPSEGLIVLPHDDVALDNVIKKGCWSPLQYVGTEWTAHVLNEECITFDIMHHGKKVATAEWSLLGMHNIHNALGAIACAHHVGVPTQVAADALKHFKNVKRRLQVRGTVNNITVYDDFAHHPTAIKVTLDALRKKVGKKARIIAVSEFGSYTMRAGIHKNTLLPAFEAADEVFIYKPKDFDWKLGGTLNAPHHIFETPEALFPELLKAICSGDQVLMMSNRGFGGLHDKLLSALKDMD